MPLRIRRVVVHNVRVLDTRILACPPAESHLGAVGEPIVLAAVPEISRGLWNVPGESGKFEVGVFRLYTLYPVHYFCDSFLYYGLLLKIQSRRKLFSDSPARGYIPREGFFETD